MAATKRGPLGTPETDKVDVGKLAVTAWICPVLHGVWKSCQDGKTNGFVRRYAAHEGGGESLGQDCRMGEGRGRKSIFWGDVRWGRGEGYVLL